MKKESSITQLSQKAWSHFSQAWMSWVLLASGGVLFMIVSILIDIYMPDYRTLAPYILCFPGALYTAILHQNGLDAAYGRKLSMLRITPSIIFASLFFIAISLYNPFPEYSHLLVTMLPDNFEYLILLNWLTHFLVSYVLVRCMFVGMIILEDKCDAIEAFRRSFTMTAHHVLLLLGVFLYLAVALGLSAMTVVGYFMVLPYTVIMKSLLFKQLHASIK